MKFLRKPTLVDTMIKWGYVMPLQSGKDGRRYIRRPRVKLTILEVITRIYHGLLVVAGKAEAVQYGSDKGAVLKDVKVGKPNSEFDGVWYE